MITVTEHVLKKPEPDLGFAETKLELPYGFNSVAFTMLKSGGDIEMTILCDTEQKLYEETFRVTRSNIDLKEIFGVDPWAYRGCLVDQSTGDRFHIWTLPSTLEKVTEAKREAMRQAMQAGGMGGSGGGNLIVPGR